MCTCFWFSPSGRSRVTTSLRSRSARRVPVDLFAPKDFVDLAWEFCRHHKPSKKEKLLKLLTLYAEVKLDQMPWKPTELRTFVEKLV